MLSRHDEHWDKHERVVEYLQAHDLEAAVLTRRCNFAWLTAGGMNHVATSADVGSASLLVTPERTLCVTSNIEGPRLAKEELRGLDIEIVPVDWHDPRALASRWHDLLGTSPCAYDARTVGLPAGAALLGADFDVLRWAMTEGEIERYRGLAAEVAAGLEASCRETRPGMSEHALAGRITGHLVERGIRVPVVLVAADDRIARYRHPLPTARRFEKYGMAVVGGERHGLHVSVTRLFSFGEVSDDLRRRHVAVCEVDAAAIGATRPGATLGNVFALICDTYAEVDFPEEWQFHHQGGPTGYLGREAKAVPGDTTPVQENQVFAWNPSIAGTKSEDTILVGADANEILSQTGDWPTTTYEAHGSSWPRCDILEL
jgi:Xaa-Pro aminopeptidase